MSTPSRVSKEAPFHGPLAPIIRSCHRLGGNGGAIKPSSGYAFAFIQKQIATAIRAQISALTKIKIRPPHKWIDLWMDDVFVDVIKDWPDLRANIFIRMARGLNGDEFALF